MKNPFFFRELSVDSPFCDRQRELDELLRYAEGKANVVLFSPRRFGKTSLVKHVQKALMAKGFTTIYVDLFGLSSIDDVAARIAKAVFEVTHQKESIFKKALRVLQSFRPVISPDPTGSVSLSVEVTSQRKQGVDLLSDVCQALGDFAQEVDHKLQVTFDEFQEIVELPESRQSEGILRSHIQQHSFSYFFVGSRRRILLAMFNEKKRPFFQSAINYELKALPHEDLVPYLQELFAKGGKQCVPELASAIAKTVLQHPYYAQKLSFFIYEVAQENIEQGDILKAMGLLLESERPVFEALLQGLSPKQIRLLEALAQEPSKSVFSLDYMKRRGLGSTGGVQGALKRLSLLDLIDQGKQGIWEIVDPIFGRWLKERMV